MFNKYSVGNLGNRGIHKEEDERRFGVFRPSPAARFTPPSPRLRRGVLPCRRQRVFRATRFRRLPGIPLRKLPSCRRLALLTLPLRTDTSVPLVPFLPLLWTASGPRAPRSRLDAGSSAPRTARPPGEVASGAKSRLSETEGLPGPRGLTAGSGHSSRAPPPAVAKVTPR